MITNAEDSTTQMVRLKEVLDSKAGEKSVVAFVRARNFAARFCISIRSVLEGERRRRIEGFECLFY